MGASFADLDLVLVYRWSIVETSDRDSVHREFFGIAKECRRESYLTNIYNFRLSWGPTWLGTWRILARDPA